MDRWALASPVGIAQPNARRDVLIVQKLLNRCRSDDPRGASLAEDGVFGSKTQTRLEEFQRGVVHLVRPDGVVGVSGPTDRALMPISPGSSSFVPSSALAALAARRAGGQAVSTAGASPIVQPGSSLATLMKMKAANPKSPLKRSWVNRALPAAVAVKAKWGVPIAVLIAQGALESHWGTIAPGNAFFGVKGHSPTGKSITEATHEEAHGKLHAENDAFRAYASLDDAADDYGRFLTVNKRYAKAFLYRDDPDRFIHEVAAAGYATKSGYEMPIKSIMAFNGFKDFDKPGARLVYNDAVSIGTFA